MARISDYFALKPSKEVGHEIIDRIIEWFRFQSSSGFLDRVKLSYNSYYGQDKDGNTHAASKTLNVGTQGESLKIKVNQFRNLLQHRLILTTSSRPSFETRAVNTDFQSQTAAILGDAILDQRLRTHKLDEEASDAAEKSLWCSEGTVEVGWDHTKGKLEIVDQEGNKKMSGDLVVRTYDVLDIARDPSVHKDRDNVWKAGVRMVNKWDLAAKVMGPKGKQTEESKRMADRILNVDPQSSKFMIEFFNIDVNSRGARVSNDMIPMWSFYHEPTELVTNGKLIQFVTEDTVFSNIDNPYGEIPYYRIVPAEHMRTPFAYTTAFDSTAIQEVYDSLISTVLTNQRAFGVQNVMMPRGANVNKRDLGGGVNVLEYTPVAGQKPEPLQLLATPTEIFNFIKELDRIHETIWGTNQIARGQELSGLSGAAMALVQSLSIQFNNGFEESWTRLLEDVGTAVLNREKQFASVPRTVLMAGKTKRFQVREYTKKDLVPIDRVTVDSGNPMARTTAGRLELAKMYIEAGFVGTPEQLIQVVATGRLEPVMEGTQTELLNISSENEMLGKAETPPVSITDDHVMHLQEHRIVGSNPDARKDPDIMKAVNAHIQEHINILSTADPRLMQIYGQPAFQPASPAGAGQPGNGKQATAADFQGLRTLTTDQSPIEQQAAQVRTAQPGDAQNALGGEPFNVDTGGLPP